MQKLDKRCFMGVYVCVHFTHTGTDWCFTVLWLLPTILSQLGGLFGEGCYTALRHYTLSLLHYPELKTGH